MKHKILILTLLFATTSVFAQLGTPLAQYSGNQLLYNPATAGLGDVLATTLTVRKQWVQIPGSPSMVAFNAHAPLKNERHAVGIVFCNESWGPLSGNFGYANYAYRMHIHGNFLSFGLQAGFFNNVVDWTKVDAKDPGDPTQRYDRRANTNFDANVGMYWFTHGYYLSFSAKHLMPPKINFENNIPSDNDWHAKMGTHFYLMSGYEIPLIKGWTLRPEWFMRYINQTPMAINLGLKAVFINKYFFGTNIQTGQNTISFTFRGFATDNLRLGYSYNVYFGAIRAAQQGSHEISLNYNVNNLWENIERNRRIKENRTTIRR
jgi:type IX secretion system PorP/SprF family membrane protein